MKLIYRITIRLALILLPIITLWAVIFYYTMVAEINDESDDSLVEYAETIIRRHLSGRELPTLNGGSNNSYTIVRLDSHDANEPFGFLIANPECGTVLFATDTYYLQYTFDGLNNIMLECNYRQDILDANVEAGLLPAKLRARTMKSHCSFDTCKEILLANDLSQVHNIVLIHLSDGNANAKEFKDGIQEATHKTVSVAIPGMKINFNKSPF